MPRISVVLSTTSIRKAFDNMNSLYLNAVFVGILSWIFLNRRNVRGDYAFLFFTVSFFGLYYHLKNYVENISAPFSHSLLIASIYFGSLSTSTILYRISPFHPLAAYPGPFIWKLSSLVLAKVSMGGRRHLILDDLHKKYGRFVRIGPNALSINSPTANNMIYSAAHYMEKSESYNKPGHVGGVSLFFKHHREDSVKRKRIWANAFTGSAVDNFFPALHGRTSQLFDCIERRRDSGGVVDLGLCLAYWSYDFMGEMVFGGCNDLELMRDGDPEGLISGGKQATVVVDGIGQTPWLMDIIWHIPVSQSVHQLRHKSAAMMRRRIQQSKEVEIRDLSSYLIDGDPHTGERISMSDLEVDSLVAIQAGSDNTGSAMALVIFFMLANPPAYKTLQAELDKAFPDSSTHLDNDKLASCLYLNACINESLRLGTPFFVPRIVPEKGTTIDGKFIPGGTIVALAAYSQQVSEENFYPDSLSFRPERWLPEGLGPKQILNKSAIVSFSSGPYVCIAKSFALQEMRIVVARMVLEFDMSFAPGFNVDIFLKGFKNMRTTILEEPLMIRPIRRRRRKMERNT